MKFIQILHIENAWGNVSIKTLSPSTFSWVSHGCAYQVLLQNALKTFNNSSFYLPSSQNAILGTVIHKIYELTLKGELRNLTDLKYKWEELIAIEKNKLTTNYPTLRNAILNDYDKRNRTIRYAMSMMKGCNYASNDGSVKKVYSEKWLDCEDLGLKGIADKLIIEDGYVDVVDFKSGYVKDDNGDIRAEYVMQLHLYAAMCQFLSFGTPRSLNLIDIDGQSYEIPYNSDYSKQLLTEVKRALQVLNDAVASRNFSSYAKPELGMCPFCSCRHICNYRIIPDDSYYKTITGKVAEIPSTNMYVLSNGEDMIYISGINVYNVDDPNYYLGKNLTFVNIARASQTADVYTYKITENTLVYEQL